MLSLLVPLRKSMIRKVKKRDGIYMNDEIASAQLRTVSQSLQACMEKLEEQVARFQETLGRSVLHSARVFRLPRILAGDEHEPYDLIPTDPLAGEDARVVAVHAYGEFFGGSGVSTKAVFRLPGVVAVEPGDTGLLKQRVLSVNQVKDDFTEVIRQVEDRNLRFEIVHRLFPMLITLQVTRQIQCYNEAMRSVTFTWGRKSSIRVVSRDELLATLKRLRHQKPLAFDEDRWLEAIQDDMVRLLALPQDVELRYRRDLKVRPMANLLLADGTKWLREANLPILILNPADNFRIGELPDYNASEKPKRGRKNPQRLTEDERYLTCLPVYRAKS